MSSDASKMLAHDRIFHALLDRAAATAAARQQAIGVRGDQPAVREHRLRLLGVALDDILHDQHFSEPIHGLDLGERFRKLRIVLDDPCSPARSADRRLQHHREALRLHHFLGAGNDARRRLRQVELSQDPAETDLVVGAPIAVEARECDGHMASDKSARLG
jgi:hypothetical protein